MHRFFIPPHWIEAKHARLEGEVACQVSRVLRMSPGDEVVLLDNTGREYAVRLTSFSKDMVEGDVLSVVQGRGEPLVSITLYQGTLKGEKFQWVLQKGTELGVATFVPIVCRRSIPRGRDTSRHARWPRIVTEAAEQSGRCRLPQILEPMPFQDACRRVEGSGISIIPWEQEGPPACAPYYTGRPLHPWERAKVWVNQGSTCSSALRAALTKKRWNRPAPAVWYQ